MGHTTRLTNQHKESHGAIGIFGNEAKTHDAEVATISLQTLQILQQRYPMLSFRHRKQISKEEINQHLQKIDSSLGQTLFVQDCSIKPDGGFLEVQDVGGNWRVILITEAKHQGKDIENIRKGIQVGKNNDQDLMVAGNAIERAFKNISEFANFMLSESYFPYVLFLAGSNFLTQNINVKRPDGRIVSLSYRSGLLNRLDRLSAANHGMSLNTNLCQNKFIQHHGKTIMLQSASIFTQGDGEPWHEAAMRDIMLDIAETSLHILGKSIPAHSINNTEG